MQNLRKKNKKGKIKRKLSKHYSDLCTEPLYCLLHFCPDWRVCGSYVLDASEHLVTYWTLPLKVTYLWLVPKATCILPCRT